jgi:hypothetical protein
VKENCLKESVGITSPSNGHSVQKSIPDNSTPQTNEKLRCHLFPKTIFHRLKKPTKQSGTAKSVQLQKYRTDWYKGK